MQTFIVTTTRTNSKTGKALEVYHRVIPAQSIENAREIATKQASDADRSIPQITNHIDKVQEFSRKVCIAIARGLQFCDGHKIREPLAQARGGNEAR